MTKPHAAKKPALQDWHKADIKAALEKAGWTLRKLAAAHGFSGSTLQHPLKKPYPNAERIIAEALGINPWEIWPSRYNAQHNPIRQIKFPLTRPDYWKKVPGVKRKA